MTYPNAIAHINASIRLDPSNVPRRVLFVQILSDSGDKQKAKAALNQLEELRPDPSRLSEESRRMLLALRTSLAG
ncbi:MAG: tetratricopeptide repeat protein [Planctomycetota bacterium]|nr:tetratricopeptide repeat protein [Planctomycetota bacterium]